MKPRIYADFHGLDDENRVRLNSIGTSRDLARLGLLLADGFELTLYTDDGDEVGQPDNLLVDGTARYSETDNMWVADPDWTTLRHESDESRIAGLNGLAGPPKATKVV